MEHEWHFAIVYHHGFKNNTFVQISLFTTVIQEQGNLMTTNNYRQNISEIIFKGWSLRQILFPVMSEEKLIQSKSSNERKLIWYLAVAKENFFLL